MKKLLFGILILGLILVSGCSFKQENRIESLQFYGGWGCSMGCSYGVEDINNLYQCLEKCDLIIKQEVENRKNKDFA